MSYYLSKTVAYPFAEARQRLAVALVDAGLGVVSELDMQATLHEKLGLERAAYVIVGSCQPELARQALELEPGIGALMPCNFVLRQLENGGVEIGVMNSLLLVAWTGNPGLESIQNDLATRVDRVLAAM